MSAHTYMLTCTCTCHAQLGVVAGVCVSRESRFAACEARAATVQRARVAGLRLAVADLLQAGSTSSSSNGRSSSSSKTELQAARQAPATPAPMVVFEVAEPAVVLASRQQCSDENVFL